MVNSRKVVPAQPVDATPSNQLIGQYFTPERRSVWLYSIKPIQGSVFLNQPSRPTFALRTPASRRVERCCADPLRPPGLSATGLLWAEKRASQALSDLRCGGLQISHLPAVWEHNLLKTQDLRSVLGRMTSGSDDVAGLERALVPSS